MPPQPDIEPDTKDWTWVLEQRCPDCGFDPGLLTDADLAPSLVANALAWPAVLAGAGARKRPRAGVWSPTEYACHVRDVHRLFDGRLRSMLEDDDPRFANWDQDVTAVEERYDLQDPAQVGPELVAAAETVARRYAGARGEQWQRPGRRSNGSVFTVATFGRYHLHDVVHHLWDVGFDPTAATVAAYDAHASAYAEGRAATAADHEAIATFAAAVPGGRVLEIGSAGGDQALALEARGLSVRRTDVSPGFVEHLRATGVRADLVDPRVGDLADPERPGRPYDGVWANASLLHVDRFALPAVLGRLAEATRPGGALYLSVKEGDGDAWSTHGHVGAPRRFTFWREEPLRGVLSGAGWTVTELTRFDGDRGETWLEVHARR